MSRRRAGLVAAALVALLAAGCEVRAEIAVEVAEDGSGTVEVAVSLDADAASRVPGLATELRLEDLEASGWTVEGPQVEDDGRTWIRAEKGFADPEQAAAVVAEVAGEDGALRGFVVTREQGFARTEYTVAGTVDLTRGLESFTDDDLAAALDGLALGESIEAIEARAGAPIDEVFTMQLSVALPGDLTATNAPERSGGRAVWQPRLGDPEVLAVQASSEQRRTRTLVLAGVAVVGALATVVVGVVVPLVGWRRRRGLRPRGRHASV